MKIKTNVKAGGVHKQHKHDMQLQHSQTVARGLKVKTNVKAGNPPPSTSPGVSSTGQ